MTQSCNLRLLIVDSPCARAYNLRQALTRAGCKVHVVSSPAAASTMVRRCSIHTGFIACDSNDDMRGLITALEELKIPHVFTGAGTGELASELANTRPAPSQPWKRSLSVV
jgi:hypothetical protein